MTRNKSFPLFTSRLSCKFTCHFRGRLRLRVPHKPIFPLGYPWWSTQT